MIVLIEKILNNRLYIKLTNFYILILSYSYNKRIYHYHIRKTGGTSINFAFIKYVNPISVVEFYKKLAKLLLHRLIIKRKIFVGWNKFLIEQGRYFYAFSHIPAHNLNLPENIIKITCFRDPVKRVVSHYNMIKYYQLNEINHISMKEEMKWLGQSFDDFIQNIPKKHLLRQLYMFSSTYNVDEALTFIKKNKVITLFTESLNSDLMKLSSKLNIKLENFNEKKYNHTEKVKEESLHFLRNLLKDEYLFLEKIRNI